MLESAILMNYSHAGMLNYKGFCYDWIFYSSDYMIPLDTNYGTLGHTLEWVSLYLKNLRT